MLPPHVAKGRYLHSPLVGRAPTGPHPVYLLGNPVALKQGLRSDYKFVTDTEFTLFCLLSSRELPQLSIWYALFPHFCSFWWVSFKVTTCTWLDLCLTAHKFNYAMWRIIVLKIMSPPLTGSMDIYCHWIFGECEMVRVFSETMWAIFINCGLWFTPVTYPFLPLFFSLMQHTHATRHAQNANQHQTESITTITNKGQWHYIKP